MIGFPRAIAGGPQGLLTLALLAVGFVLPFFCCIRRQEEGDRESGLDLFQPGLAVFLFYFMYLWVPACYLWLVRGYDSRWALLDAAEQQSTFNHTLSIVLLGLAAFGISYRTTGHRQRATESLPQSGRDTQFAPVGITRLVAFTLVALGLAANFSLLRQLGPDVFSVFTQLSPSVALTTTVVAGPLDSFVASLTWGILLLYFTFLDDRRVRPFVAALLVIAFFGQFVVLGGKRSYITPLIFLPVVWHSYLKKRISTAKAGVLFSMVFVLMAVLLLGRILIPLTLLGGAAYGTAADAIGLDPVGFYLDSPDLAQFDIVMICVRHGTTILNMAGGWLEAAWRYNVQPALYIVPHALWAGKPTFQDLGQLVYYQFILPEANVGFAVGIFGALYIFGGLIGVVAGMAILGWSCRAAYQCLAPYRGAPATVFAYSVALWTLFMFLRFGTLGFTMIYVIQRLLIGSTLAVVLMALNRQAAVPRRSTVINRPHPLKSAVGA